MITRYFHDTARVSLAFVLVAIIALIDWRVDAHIAFGFLYLFPVLLVGTVWPRWQILATALVCTLLADLFDPFGFTVAQSLPQDILVFTSLAGTGLFAFEVTRSRRREMETLRRVESEVAARREAEEQLEFLIEQLEEESEEDESYYIDNSTIDYLEENGADDDLVTLLRKALGEEDGVEIKIGEEEAAAG